MSVQPIRVLQILPALHVGGVERGTMDWALALKEMGHEPIVVSGGGHGENYLSEHDILHIKLPVGKKSLRSLFLITKLRQLFAQLQVDVVHARSRLPAWLSHWAIAKMDNKPAFVTTLHGLHTVSPYASIMAQGDAVIAVSETAKQYLTTHFAQHLKATPQVIYRGVDVEEFPYGLTVSPKWLAVKEKTFGPISQSKLVLLPGRFSEIKGAMGLIPWLQQAEVGVKLLVNAKPDESQFSQKFATELENRGLSNKVIWWGIERDMKQLYALADVALSVNKKPESFGRTVLEALTIGCPVVAFNHGGVSEVMGQLFPQGLVENQDWQSLADKINRFLSQAPKVPQHNQFTNHSQFEQTMAVYQTLLEQRQ